MRRVDPWRSVSLMIASLAVGALACGLPSFGGSQGEGGSGSEAGPQVSATEASPTAVSVDTPAPSSANGECANTYFPVIQGATWNYEVTGGSSDTVNYTDTISELTGDGFVLTSEFDDATRTQRWSCKSNGLLALDFGGASATLAVADLQAVFDTTKVSGITLPRDLTAGDTWSQSFTIEGNQALPGDQTAEVKGSVDYSSTAGEMESVTVPAGTFEALRVESTTKMDITIKLSGFTVPTTIEGTVVRWYAPEIGYVRSVETSNVFGTEVEVTIELTGYRIP